MARKIENMGVVITGASAGIGAALARELNARGARLLLAARRLDRLEQLNAELGGRHILQVCDVASPTDCATLVDAAFAALGRVDTLVLNAGYGETRRLADMTLDRVHAMFATNLYGTLEPIRLALPRLLSQPAMDGYRGQIMVVSSAAARRGLPMGAVYSATKSAQLSVAEGLRVELAGSGVAVTTVHPIGTRTEFFDVASVKGGSPKPLRAAGGMMQSADLVAKRMVAAIERPRPEVWTFLPARVALAVTALFPRLGDRIMMRVR